MLYLHVPFCRSRCIYCDFYSTTAASLQDAFLQAVDRELTERADYLPSHALSTVYIGGGTPSTLGPARLERLFAAVLRRFTLLPQAEVTLEANPDDITPAFADALRSLPVNRLSLGVQTFDNALLRFLRRRHDARRAIEAVNILSRAGFSNISIDLIYSLPGQSVDLFMRDLDQAFALPITHLSAYALSYSPATPLHRLRSRGIVTPASDELCEQMYFALLDRADRAGFDHYEISNFARPAFHSRHNSGYWTGRPYLGLGPSACSYNLSSRRRNNPDLRLYTTQAAFSEEQLTPIDLRNEMIMTRLRTREGLPIPEFTRRFGSTATDLLLRAAEPHIASGRLTRSGDHLRLTRRALFVSDGIIADLFRSEE